MREQTTIFLKLIFLVVRKGELILVLGDQVFAQLFFVGSEKTGRSYQVNLLSRRAA